MSNVFDQFDQKPQGGNVFDQFDEGVQAPQPRTRTAGEIAKDTALSVTGGAATVVKPVAMALDRIRTGRWIGPATEAVSEFQASQQEAKSEPLRQEMQASAERTRSAGQAVEDAIGRGSLPGRVVRQLAEFKAGAGEILTNPDLLLDQAVQMAPMMKATQLAGRGTEAAAGAASRLLPAKAADVVNRTAGTGGAVAAGAGMQGADVGTEAYQRMLALPEETWQQSQDYRDLAAKVGAAEAKRQIASSRAAVAAAQGGAISLAANALPGGAALERALVSKRMPSSAAAIGRGAAGEFVSEGLEEGGGKLAQNFAVAGVDPKQDVLSGVGEAAGQGSAMGGLLGGGSTAIRQGLTAWQDRAQGVRPAQDQGGATPPAGPGVSQATPAPASSTSSTSSTRAEPTNEAEKALFQPRNLTALDRVQELDAEIERATARRQDLASPDYGPAFDGDRADTEAKLQELQAERDQLAAGWPKMTRGAPSTFTTEAGARVDAEFALVDAAELVTSHDTNLRQDPRYPQELQPRERDRAASEMQIGSIVQRLDPARLGSSADAANGAPIVGADGLVESGNARTIALKRTYEANGAKAAEYRAWLRDNAASFGLDPAAIESVRQPVLVRLRRTPVDRAEFARQANASTVAQMSPSEQARSDAKRIDTMEDLQADESGDFSGPASRPFVRRFLAKLPVTEQAGMIDSAGNLSTAGNARIRNAVLARAYGDSPVLQRMVESMDDNLRNVSKALIQAAPRVASMREAVQAGARFDADITPALMEAVEELSRIKDAGRSVQDALAQAGLLGDQFSPDVREILAFLAENMRRPKKMAEFIEAYMAALDEAGNPAQDGLFGAPEAPSTAALLDAAKRSANADPDASPEAPAAQAAGAGREAAGKPAADAGDAGGGAQGEWVAFPPESGTLGIPRADMPQVEAKDRAALLQFLQARGIGYEKGEARPGSLKPAQAEFSTRKVQGFVDRGGPIGDRSVLVSADNYVVDGHHQWMWHVTTGAPVPVIRLDADIRAALAAVEAFPSTKRAEGAPDLDALRRAAVLDFKAAAADLADLLTPMARAAMVPENTPGLMPTLVKLFDAGIRIVGTDVKKATKWVQAELRKMPELAKLWNRIGPETYRKAALQALEGMTQQQGQAGLFDTPEAASDALQGDLFAAAPPAAPASERLPGEADKAFAKRVVDKRQAPATLPEQYDLYFKMDGARVVPVADLISTKSAEENQQGGDNGPKRMAAAAAGELSKRAPVTVMPSEASPGKFEVVDGNGTLTSVSRYGWRALPVAVVSREEGLRMMAEDAAKDAAKAGVPMIDGRPYDMARDNFVPPPPADVFDAGLLARVDGYLERYFKGAAAYSMSAQDRADGERLLAPRMKLAQEAKPAYDQKVIDIAKRTGALGQLLAPLKGMKRSVEKMHQDAVAEGRSMRPEDIKDLLRSTIVVQRYEDADAVIEAIKAEFNVLRIKDRRGDSPRAQQGWYADVLINVTMPNGTVAEIQVNVPAMLTAKAGKDDKPAPGAGGHQLYEAARVLPDADEKKAEIYSAMTELYQAAYAAARDFAAQDRKVASDMGAAPRGPASSKPGSATSVAPSSDALNQAPSGKRTNSSPLNEARNVQPAGNFSGTRIDNLSGKSVAGTTDSGYSAPAKQEQSDADRNAGQGSDEGKGAAAARGAAGQRRAGQVRKGAGQPDLFGGGQPDAAAADGGALGQAGADGVRGADEDGRGAGAGSRARRVAGVPAGRELPAKSGLNYSFGPDDLTYEGSWAKKAAQNVEAVELLKKLQAEKRQATREEQQVLAKFVGWGSSELANTLFGKKLDKVREQQRDFEQALASMDALKRDYLRKGGQYRGDYADSLYYTATNALRAAGKLGPHEYPERITREQLQAAKPAPSDLRYLELRDRLKAAMTPEEWAEAARSTQYAHYTSKAVVTSMWKAMERMGFAGGTVLEPGAGIGVFPGLMPQGMAASSLYTGIEFDSITGGILQQLFPDEQIRVESFVDTKLPRDFYDVAVGNPPFSQTKILGDPEYAKRALSLHDYFFAKTIDRVKPGGLVVFVTSRYTMDKLDDKARQYLAERADLVGAIRLPQTAFKQNAGTEVVTDVLFLRKKVKGEKFEHAKDWLKTAEAKDAAGNTLMVKDKDGKERPAMINEFFAANPDMVLGQHANTGSMYSDKEYTVTPLPGDIEAHFAKAVEKLPAGIYQAPRGGLAEAAKVREIDFNPKAKKEGNYYVTDAGVLMQRESGVGQRVDLKNKAQAELIKDFVPLRDALKQAHYDQLTEGAWEQSLAALQKAYKAFTDKNGNINQFKVRKVNVKKVDEDTGEAYTDEEQRRSYPILDALKDDPDWTLVAALESINDDTGEIKPSDFLTKRVLGKPVEPQVKSPADALLTVLNDLGQVDMAVVAERAGVTEKEAIEALGTAVYQDPSRGWVMADEYLSGNVKRKLEEARVAARTDRRFERNVTALEAVQPAPKSPSQINVGIGMNWIPGRVYQQFLQEVAKVRTSISWNARTKEWVVQELGGGRTAEATEYWGTDRRNVVDLMEHALTGRKIIVKDTDPKTKTTSVNESATEAANEKLNKLREAFQDWIWKDTARTDELVRLFNDKFNTTVARTFDGRHLTLPGSSKTFKIFDHVKRGAWRIIQRGNTYLAHAVGSGKTFQMVIAAMEQKRLGLIKKPMIVVPNHMLQQFASEWQQLYPAARLMVADETNFHTDNRRRFVSRVALSDLDGVVITHSAFKLLDLDPDFKREMIDQQMEYLQAALEEVGGDKADKRDPKVKQIQRQLEAFEQKLEKLLSSAGKDANVRFDELGVDFLMVDEAHEFRKLDFATSRQVKGLSPQGSARAFDLFMKTRWLEKQKPGRSLVMASGTPITNTVAELYSVQKFMDPQALEDRGMEDFDSWAAMFARESTRLEANAAGTYEPVTRFNKFVNVPELTQMFRDFADVLTADHLAALLGDKRPKVAGGARKLIVTPKVQAYAGYQKELARRMEISREWKPSKAEPNNPDPIIRIIGDGRLAAIDMRFADPSLPSDPGSKLNRMIDDVIAKAKATADMEFLDKAGNPEPNKGATMMVFSDLGFGAGVAASRGFNARAWFEKRMRDAGIPPSQVAFMSDYKKSTDKLKLFKDVNAGRVRILVGSSKNMGTGVNAQQRLKALFHLDSPWYPSDLEQREGRIIRQGNKNKEVEIYAYAAKGSYDEVMWQMLASKQQFIDLALSGDQNVRELEDLSSQSEYEMAAALVAEDQRVLQLAGLNADVAKLQRLYQAHEETRARNRDRYLNANSTIDFLRAQLPKAEAAAAKVEDLSGDKFKAKIGTRTVTERKAWVEALETVFKDWAGKQTQDTRPVGSISGFEVVFRGTMQGGNYMASLDLELPGGPFEIMLPGSPVAGVAMRAQNAVADVAMAPVKMRERITELAAQRDALAGRIDAPFPMAQLLAEKQKEAADLAAEIARGPEVTEQTIMDDWAAATGAVTPLLSRSTRMFHTTRAENIAGIARDGLVPGKPARFEGVSSASRVSLAATEQGAAYYGGPGDVMLRTKAGFKPETLDLDPLGGDGSFTVGEAVPADQLEAKIGGKWVSLDAAAKAIASGARLDDISTAGTFKKGDKVVTRDGRNGSVVSVDTSIGAVEVKLTNGMKMKFLGDHVRLAAGPSSAVFSRAVHDVGAGVKPADLEAMAAAGRKAMPGLPPVVVLNRPSEAPEALRKFIEARGAMGDAEGALHDGKIYLFAAHLADMDRAEHVLLQHEAGHAGLAALLGTGKRQALQAVYNQNATVRRQADKLRKANPKMSVAEATEEVLVDMPRGALVKLTGWRRLVQTVRDALQARGLARVAGWLDRLLRGSLNEQQRADLAVADLMRDARAALRRPAADVRGAGTALQTGKLADDIAAQEKWLQGEARARGFQDIEDLLAKDYPLFEKLAELWRKKNPADALLSRAPAQPTAQERAEAIIQDAAGRAAPLDKLARAATRFTGIERLASAVYDKAAFILDRYTPERIKAGVVSDYGVPQAVIDQRALLQGRQRVQLRKAGELIDKLATLTRAESRVAYAWMNEADPEQAARLMDELPAESVKVLGEVSMLIEKLSKEAIALGQLAPDAYQRNRFAYLRRSYLKHVLPTDEKGQQRRQRAIAILGEQYKGRGLTEAAPMRQIQNIAPEWWQRKVKPGQADASLKGQKFIRLERRARQEGAGVAPLLELDGPPNPGATSPKEAGRLQEIHYYPAGEPLPAKYADWHQAGTWEVRTVKGGDAIMWRDFTKAEREKMGEIDEARFAIAKTLHGMIHDVEVGRYLEWMAHTQAVKPGAPVPGVVVEATERYRDTYAPGEWVQVPDTKIPGTNVARYGKLAGRYLPGPVWNDLRQVVSMQTGPLGEAYQTMLSAWKTAKTALSPAVHTNNIMSSFVMADWHDVGARHVAKALRIMLAAQKGDGKGLIGGAGNKLMAAGIADREAAREILNRYQDSGGDIGGWVTAEISRDQIDPLLQAIEAEARGEQPTLAAQLGVMAALQHALHLRWPEAWAAFKGGKVSGAAVQEASNLIDLYQSEDDVFRLAAWLKAKEEGKSDMDAGKAARTSFLDYRVNAPWIQAMRQTAWPFISFSYRAIPMLLETAGKRPHKLLKLMAVAGALNALGVLIAGGGDDEERKLLPEEKAGRIWGMVPKLIRMPWNDDHGSPVYLDVRRFIPVGDVLDVGAGQSAIPMVPALQPGGPLIIFGEVVFNKSAFTGKPITLETDTGGEQAGKVVDHLWKAFAPNILGLPGTYATTGVMESLEGKTDAFGREMSTAQALSNTIGVKLGSYPTDVLRRNLGAKAMAEMSEIDTQIAQLKRQRMTNRLTQTEFEEKVAAQQAKKVKISEKLREKLN